jgi:SPP1 gp7 family putative phage head morphogenesis protein
VAFGFSAPGDPSQVRLGDLLATRMAAANILGRLQIATHVIGKIKRPVRLSAGLGPERNFAEDDVGQDGATLGVGFSFDLPNDNAAEYLRNLTPVTRQTFDSLTRQYQRDAFTVAGVSDQRLIGKVRDTLAEILAKGGTRSDFHDAVDELTTDAGVRDLAAFELDTVFQSNTGKAYSAGRLEQMREPGVMEALPYWQYWTVGDLRVRPAHAVLDGFCARAIDPVWLRIYPPNGYNCRCSVVPLLPEDAPDGSDEGGIERLPVMAAFARPPGWTSVL